MVTNLSRLSKWHEHYITSICRFNVKIVPLVHVESKGIYDDHVDSKVVLSW